MTLAEFKAWFSGFTESMDSTPNEKQWARIKARVAEIDDKPTTYPVFVDRYRPYWINTSWPSMPQHMLFSSMSTAGDVGMLSQNKAGSHDMGDGGTAGYFDSHSAMLDLGKAEFQAVQ